MYVSDISRFIGRDICRRIADIPTPIFGRINTKTRLLIVKVSNTIHNVFGVTRAEPPYLYLQS